MQDIIRNTLATFGTEVLFIAAFFVAELFWPAERQRVFKGRWFNIRSLAITDAMYAITAPVVVLLPAWLGARLGSGYIDLGLAKPDGFLQAGLALLAWLLILDFFYYWWHRLQHSGWFFWAAHRLHHSDETFNASTSKRGHWVEAFYAPLVIGVPPTVLFSSIGAGEVPLVSWFFLSVWGYLNHANLPITFGPFLSSPLWHRLHHSRLPEHEGKNLAGYFPLYDIIFGTYVPAKRGVIYPTGLYNGERETGVIAAHLVPFKVWRASLQRIRLRGRQNTFRDEARENAV